MSARPLHVFMTADAVGGVWQYALDLADGLARHGARTTLAVLGPGPSPGQRRAAEAVPALGLLDTGLPLDWTADAADELRSASSRLASLAAEHGADIVHLNAPALAAGASGGAPVVAVHHSCVATWWDAVRGGPLPDDFAWRTRLVADGLRAADAVLAPTSAFAVQAEKCYGRGLAYHIVPNGRRPVEASAQAPGAFAFTAGRLWDEGKNVAALDRAAPLMDVPVLAAGSLGEPNGSMSVFPNLDCLGSLDDAGVAGRLAEQPIFVSAALYEPFGLAVLEAAQASCALVLSDIPTFREIWDGAALFVPAKNEAAIARTVNALCADPDRRRMLGNAALARAQRFTTRAMTDGVLAVYESVLSARPQLRRAGAGA